MDEAFTAHATGLSHARLLDEFHWLYYTLLKSWSEVAGRSEFALRVPSVAAAVGSVVLLYGLTKRLLGSRVAFVAALLLAVNPFVVKWSQQARSYSFLVALTIGTLWLLLAAHERRQRALWVGYGFALVVTIIWHFFSALLILPVHMIIAWRAPQARVTWAFALVISSPWILKRVAVEDEGGPTTWLERPGVRDIAEAAISVPGLLGIGLLLSVAGAAFVEDPWRRLLVAWAVLPGVLALVGSAYKPMFLDRYLIVSTPAFAILSGVALTRLAGHLRVAAISATAGAASLGLFLWYAPSGGENWKGENWRAASELVMRDGGALVEPFWASPAFGYYGGVEHETGWLLERQENPRDFTPVSGARTYWFGERLRALKIRPP